MVVHDTENDAKYKCAECNLQFGTPRDLSRHLNKTARHGGQPSPCAICHKPLTRPDSRARHERRCRERFGVTEEMWQGIERERQRGRRKSISVDSVDDANRLPGDDSGGNGGGDPAAAGQGRSGGGSAGGSVSSRSRAPSISDLSDPNDLAAAFASAQVASSAPTFAPGSAPESRFAPQPGEPNPWTRRRSASLRNPHPVPTAVTASSPSSSSKDTAIDLNGRKRRESSPHTRRGVPPPQARGTSSPTINPSWRPLNRPLSFHQVREDSPPFEPPSSPMAMYESDGESMAHASMYRQPPLSQPSHRWATLAKRDGPIVELAQEGDDDEIDELAGDEDGSWHPSASPRAHAHHAHHAHHHIRTTEGTMMGPPPKKKLLGFELDHAHAHAHASAAGSVAGWSAHRSQQR
jgi:hypothetical protein